MIREINSFSMENYNCDPRDETAFLYFNGNPTGKIVSGHRIKKQFETDDFYLLIASYSLSCNKGDCIKLFDKSFNLISKRHIGLANYSLSVEDVIPIKDNKLFVTFPNESGVVVQICQIPFLLAKPFLRIKHCSNSYRPAPEDNRI